MAVDRRSGGTPPRPVTAEQVPRFRLAASGLTDPGGLPEAVLAGWSVQESPPGAATNAVLARTTADVPVGWIEGAIADSRTVASLYNPRTATTVVGAEEAPALATAYAPTDDAGIAAIASQAFGRRTDLQEPVEVAVEAISAALDGRELSRDDLHEELRGRLPEALLPWCEGCQSHHAKRGLLVMASLRGRLCLAGKVGRQPLFARTDQWLGGWAPPAADDARADLVRRYLRQYGPSAPGDFAEWAGLGKPHARSLWELVGDELAPVTIDDGPVRWILADDLPGLEAPAAARGATVLGPGDPLLQLRDREALVPDPSVRKKLWTAIPTTGLIIADGDAVALWKAKKTKQRLDITVDAYAKVDRSAKDQIEEALERIAPHRGATSIQVNWQN